MICKGLFSGEILTVLGDDAENSIIEILKLIDYSKEQNTKYYTIYAREKDIALTEWVYDTSDPCLRDIKRELSIAMTRSEELGIAEWDSFINEEATFIIGNFSGDTIQNIFDYLDFKQNRLKGITAKSDFGKELQECYYYIYFDKAVPSSINTLENNFAGIRKEIVEHLAQLDHFCKSHPERLEGGYDNERFAIEFKGMSNINCSPQAGRNSVGLLKRKYVNEYSGASECLICELHTKFNTNGKDRTKQDRIYFHKGKKDILQDKLIVIHIGKHL